MEQLADLRPDSMSDTGWKGLWRLCQVILLLLHVWFGKCQVVPACHVEDCYPLKESSDAVQLPLWRAFQARTVMAGVCRTDKEMKCSL